MGDHFKIIQIENINDFNEPSFKHLIFDIPLKLIQKVGPLISKATPLSSSLFLLPQLKQLPTFPHSSAPTSNGPFSKDLIELKDPPVNSKSRTTLQQFGKKTFNFSLEGNHQSAITSKQEVSLVSNSAALANSQTSKADKLLVDPNPEGKSR